MMSILATQPILNGPQISAPQLLAGILRVAPHCHDAPHVATVYTVLGALTGLGNVLPCAQMFKECADGTSDRFVQSNNPAGIGADDTGAWGNVFPTLELGVLAQMAHLYNYAVAHATADRQWLAAADPRFRVMTGRFGCAPRYIDLSRKWNSPNGSLTYGADIITRGNALIGVV